MNEWKPIMIDREDGLIGGTRYYWPPGEKQMK